MLPLRRLTLAVALLSALTHAQQPTASITHPAFPTGPTTPLGAKITELLADPAAARAHWGIAVTALDGTPIYGYREGELHRPASNDKLFTTAAAVALLGPQATVTTTVSFKAPDKNGVSTSSLILTGVGDSGLSGQDFPYQTPAELKAAGVSPAANDPLRSLDDFAASISKQGVKLIAGDVVGDDSAWVWEPYPIAWDIGDMLTGDGAPVSALTINDNLLVLTITPGPNVNAPATASVTPDIGYYQLEVNVKTVATGTHADLQIERAPGSKVVRIYGTIALGSPYKTEIAIMDPPQFAAMAFKLKLQQHGVEVTGVARAQHRLPLDGESFVREAHDPLDLFSISPVAASKFDGVNHITLQHVSPTLVEDVKLTLKVSQNLHAELMLRRLGEKFGNASNTVQGVRVVRQFAINAGVDGDDFFFYDGSGMSSHDLVAPRATAKLLSFATTQPWFAQWKASFPIGGVDGSLEHRFTDSPLKGHVFAKTGTLGESRALSGYLDCASGKQVIFSIMVDNHLPGTPADRTTMDKIVAAIAATQ